MAGGRPGADPYQRCKKLEGARIGRLVALHIPCGEVRSQPQHGVLEIVLLHQVAAAEAALLNVLHLGAGVFFGAVPRDEMRAAVS